MGMETCLGCSSSYIYGLLDGLVALECTML